MESNSERDSPPKQDGKRRRRGGRGRKKKKDRGQTDRENRRYDLRNSDSEVMNDSNVMDDTNVVDTSNELGSPIGEAAAAEPPSPHRSPQELADQGGMEETKDQGGVEETKEEAETEATVDAAVATEQGTEASKVATTQEDKMEEEDDDCDSDATARNKNTKPRPAPRAIDFSLPATEETSTCFCYMSSAYYLYSTLRPVPGKKCQVFIAGEVKAFSAVELIVY